MESQYPIRLIRMEAADFCSCFIRMIAANHFDPHITAGYISALPDLRLIDQLIVRKEDSSIFPGIFDDGIDLLFVFCALNFIATTLSNHDLSGLNSRKY